MFNGNAAYKAFVNGHVLHRDSLEKREVIMY
jgi:hypothetical protein